MKQRSPHFQYRVIVKFIIKVYLVGMMKNWEDRKWRGCRKIGEYKVMFDNSFYFLFSKTCFWEYKEKKKQFSCIFEIKNMFGQLKFKKKNSFLKKKIENTKICCYQYLNFNTNLLNETNLLN